MNPIDLDNYQKARAQLLVRHPFYASLVLSTEWIEDPTVKTAQTDYTRVYFNPTWLKPKSIADITFIMIHEIKHIILMHNQRMRTRKPRRWNHACDFAINQEEIDTGLSMPIDPKTNGPAGLYDKQFTGMTSEQIYDFLTLQKQQPGKGKGKGTGAGKGQGDPEEDDEDDPSDELSGDLTGPSGKDGKQDMSPEEENAIGDKIKGMVANAATLARQAGKLPAGLELLVDGIINPPQPWEMILREFMQRMVQTNETWNRRDRRFTTVLPTRYDVGMGELCIIGDTSASMLGDKIWNQVASEINYCLEYVKPERTRVLWADARARSHEQVFEPGEEVVLEPRGGGGTDMRLPLKYMEQYDPCVVIIVTDCETPWPDEPTPYPLIVASTTKMKCPDWALRLQLRH